MQNSLAGSILKSLGLTGTGFATGSLIPPSNTPQSQDRLFREFQDAGRVSDPNIWSKYGSTMQRPTSFEAMLQLWDEMSGWDLIAAALSEIVDEATQTDQNSPGVLWYECNDAGFEDELNNMLEKINVEDIISSQIWHVAGLGNHFEKIQYAPKDGVLGLSFVHPMEMRRYWLEKNRHPVGFRWLGHQPNKEDVFAGPDGQPIQRVSLNFGNKNSLEDLWYPWDFLHFRRMHRMRISEHGEPIFDEAQGIYKKLRIALDQMVVHRAQVQPDRYVMNIDVQDQPPMEQMKNVQRWKQSLRSKLAFGGDNSQMPTQFQSFYNPMALDTVLWVAKPKGFNHTVEKLQGTPNVPDVYDIEMLTNLFFSIIGMPKSWLGLGQGGEGQPMSGKALLAQDMRFLRKIKSIRRPITQGYTWLAYFHALLQNKNIEQLDIKAMMPPIGSLEDQVKMELLKLQTEVLDGLSDVMEKYQLPREAWIEVVFKRYLHLPDDIVNVFITSLPAPVDTSKDQEESKKTIPTTALLAEIDKRLGGKPSQLRLARQIKEAVSGEMADRNNHPKFKTRGNVVQVLEMVENDRIHSSFGPGNKNNGTEEFTYRKPDAITKRASAVLTESAIVADKPAENEPGYRKYMGGQ